MKAMVLTRDSVDVYNYNQLLAYVNEGLSIAGADFLISESSDSSKRFGLSSAEESPTQPLIGVGDSQIEEFEIESTELRKNNEIGIDWLQGSISNDNFVNVVMYLSAFFGEVPLISSRGIIRGYGASFGWFQGDNETCMVNVCFDRDREDSDARHSGRFVLQFQGKFCGHVDYDSFYDLCVSMSSLYGFRCTRIDTKFDDYERVVSIEELHRNCLLNNFSGFKKFNPRFEHSVIQGVVVQTGSSLELGKRKNSTGKFMRIYDKNLESEGVIDCIRYEVEWTKKRAERVFNRLFVDNPRESFVGVLGSIVGGCVTFLERKDKNLSRGQILAFWEIIIDRIGSAKIPNPKKITTIEGKKDWIEENVTRSLAIIRRTYRTEKEFLAWLEDLLFIGEEKMDARAFKLLQNYCRQGDKVRVVCHTRVCTSSVNF